MDAAIHTGAHHKASRIRPSMRPLTAMAIRLLSITSSSQKDRCGALVSALHDVAAETAEGAVEGIGLLRGSDYDVVLMFSPLPEWCPEELIEELQRVNPLAPVIVISREPSLEQALNRDGGEYSPIQGSRVPRPDSLRRHQGLPA